MTELTAIAEWMETVGLGSTEGWTVDAPAVQGDPLNVWLFAPTIGEEILKKIIREAKTPWRGSDWVKSATAYLATDEGVNFSVTISERTLHGQEGAVFLIQELCPEVKVEVPL